jgi:pentatricopeptide repeat protein
MREEGVNPDVFTWTLILNGWANSGSPEATVKAEALLNRMREEGVKPNVVTWIQAGQAWATSRLPEAPAEMEELLQRMRSEGAIPSVVTWNVVISFWVKTWLTEASERIEDILQHMRKEGVVPSVITWDCRKLLRRWTRSCSICGMKVASRGKRSQESSRPLKNCKCLKQDVADVAIVGTSTRGALRQQ